MTAINTFKSQFLFTTHWFVDNPVRIQTAILVLSALAATTALVMGLGATSGFFAGYAGGGSGGSG